MNRKIFFDVVRRSIFGGSLNQKQVDAMNGVFDAWESTGETDLRWLASILGNIRIEVGSNMYPVREGFAKNDRGAIAHVTRLYEAGKIKRNYALPDPETGKSYYGRGQIQITHEENYDKAGDALGIDLVNDPDQALDPKVSARIAVLSLIEGWWRGDHKGRKNLARYFNDETEDFDGARDMVNGDGERKGAELAQVSILFLNALRQADKPAPELEATSKPKGTVMSIILGSVMRHVLMALGGALLGDGLMDGDAMQQVVGGLVAMISQVVALIEKDASPMTIIQSIVRHALTLAGGFVVAKGWAEQSVVDQVMGVIVAISGQTFSITDKMERLKATKSEG